MFAEFAAKHADGSNSIEEVGPMGAVPRKLFRY